MTSPNDVAYPNADSVKWRADEIYVPNEVEALRRDIELDFRGWVSRFNDGNGNYKLDYFTDYYDSEPVGNLEPDEPLDKLETLQIEALKTEDVIQFEKYARKELADIFNSFGGERDNRARILLDGKDFRGISVSNLAYRGLEVWRSRLVMHRRQNDAAELFETAPEFDCKKIKTPSLADRYLYNYFSEHDTIDAQSRQRIDSLFSKGLPGFIAVADVFYGGNASKAYQNMSALSKLTKRRLPSDFRAFHGSTIEINILKERLTQFGVRVDFDTYTKLIDDLYGGNATKAHQNLAVAAAALRLPLPQGIRSFRGNTTEMRYLKDHWQKIQAYEGFEGYKKLADIFFEGDAHKAFINLSAIAAMISKKPPAGIQGFHGTTAEMDIFRGKFGSTEDANGFDAYVQLADELTDGDALKAFFNMSAVANMTGQKIPPKMHFFKGTTVEMKNQKSFILSEGTFDDYCKIYYPRTSKSDRKVVDNYKAMRMMLIEA